MPPHPRDGIPPGLNIGLAPGKNSEGAGNAGRWMRPQPCVRNEEAHKRSHHGHTGITRHSPRDGFNGFFRALPGDRAFLPPSPRGFSSAKLDASVGTSGPHDFAVRDQHRSSSRYCRVHRIPRPTSVTIAIRPSCGYGMAAGCKCDLGETRR
jgi:hypothetical protein